jgi:hypothetical protein
MTRLAAFRFAALLALALGLAGCGVISTLVEGSKYAKAGRSRKRDRGEAVGWVQLVEWAAFDCYRRLSSAL